MIGIIGFNGDNLFNLTAETFCREFNRDFSLRTRRDQSIKCDCCASSPGFDSFDLKLGITGVFDDKIMGDIRSFISQTEIMGIGFRYSDGLPLSGVGGCRDAEKTDRNNESEQAEYSAFRHKNLLVGYIKKMFKFGLLRSRSLYNHN